MKKKILIFGATGFLGRSLKKDILKKNIFKITCIKKNKNNFNASLLEKKLKSKKFALFSHNIKQNIFMFSMVIKISQIILFKEFVGINPPLETRLILKFKELNIRTSEKFSNRKRNIS